MTHPSEADSALTHTWATLGIAPPCRARHPDLDPRMAALAEIERLDAQTAALLASGRLPALAPGRRYVSRYDGPVVC